MTASSLNCGLSSSHLLGRRHIDDHQIQDILGVMSVEPAFFSYRTRAHLGKEDSTNLLQKLVVNPHRR